MVVFDMTKQKALKELLEVLSKGINLLASANVDKDLYDAFEKYADSTIKMVNNAYGQQSIWSFQNNYMPYDHFSSFHNIYNQCNTALTVMDNNQSAEYREKLKHLLQKLISMAKIVVYE